MRVAFFILGIAIVAARPAHAQRGLKDIPPPDPAAEVAAMQVADGYEVSLFAADPLISKPLQMNFDARGRLWVSSSSIYPHIRPGEVANDTVTILEDKDGDGRADAATTFADGLLMPTAVLPDDRGGAYVANSTELVHFSDTTGDGKADARRVVLSGFGAEDTHHIIHTFRWGPDARLYFNQSIYIHSHVETPQGVKRLNGGGIWRFEPASLGLDVFARGWVNTWGHVFDRWGRSLATDGAGSEGIYYGFPGAAYQAAVGAPRILHGMNPGSPKYCGLEIIDGRHLPDDAQGMLVTNDFRANRVCRFRLTEAGSGFASEKLPDLIHSKRVTFRPIDVKMGPDGAIYIADWYNPIIQHGEVDFHDPRRDRTHGRIWRVTAKGRGLVPRVDFTKLSVPALLAQMAAAESYTRDMARRELFVRGGDAVRPEIDRWLASLDPRGPEFEQLRLEALRLKQGLDTGSAGDVDAALLAAVLGSPDSRARAAACRIVCDWADRLDKPVEMLARAVDDPAAQVRLEAVRALGALGGQRAAELALHAVDHDRDASLDYSAWLAARELRDAWLPAVLAGTFDDGGRLGRLVFAVEAVDAADAVGQIANRLDQPAVPPADRAAAVRCIARLGNADQLRTAFDVVVDPNTAPAEAAAILSLMVEAHGRRHIMPAGDISAVANLVSSADDGLATRAIQAIAAWRLEAGVNPVAAVTTDTGKPLDLRRVAIAALGGIPGDGPRAALLALAGAPHADAVRAAAIAALVPRSIDVAAAQAVAFLKDPADAAAREVVFRSFLAAKGGAASLAKAIDQASASLGADVLKAGTQAISAAGRPEPVLATALEAAAARSGTAPTTAASPHAMSDAEFDTFLERVRTHGDRARGEAIYARESLKCVSCHRIGDEGGRVGPALTAIGASSPLDYIIDSLVYPAKNVKEGYNTLVILTDDGQVLTGIPVSRSDEELLLRDAAGKEVKIATSAIDEEAPGTSLMPAGLVDSLSREEFTDLVRYLSELGK